jgi:hypothetical protein
MTHDIPDPSVLDLAADSRKARRSRIRQQIRDGLARGGAARAQRVRAALPEMITVVDRPRASKAVDGEGTE